MSAEEKRQPLIDGVIRAVSKYGLDHTTTKVISQEAGVNEVYIYRCFREGKEELFRSAFDFVDRAWARFIICTLREAGSLSPDIYQRSHHIWNRCWTYITDHPQHCRFYVEYCHSNYFRLYSRQDHWPRFAPLADLMAPYFRDGTRVDLLLRHTLNTVLTFAERVLSGELENSPQISLQLFQMIYGASLLFVRPELVAASQIGALFLHP